MGFLTVHPAGVQRPPTASLNFSPDRTVANHVPATLGSSGDVAIFNSNGNTHVIVDVTGYYAPTDDRGLRAVDGTDRVLDTREGLCDPAIRCGPLTGGQDFVMPRPGGAAAGGDRPRYSTVAVVSPRSSGYVTVWPSGAKPLASSLNYAQGITISNAVLTALLPARRGPRVPHLAVAHGARRHRCAGLLRRGTRAIGTCRSHPCA